MAAQQVVSHSKMDIPADVGSGTEITITKTNTLDDPIIRAESDLTSNPSTMGATLGSKEQLDVMPSRSPSGTFDPSETQGDPSLPSTHNGLSHGAPSVTGNSDLISKASSLQPMVQTMATIKAPQSKVSVIEIAPQEKEKAKENEKEQDNNDTNNTNDTPTKNALTIPSSSSSSTNIITKTNLQKAKTVGHAHHVSADAEYGFPGRMASQSSADQLQNPNADERFLEFAEMHLAQALNEIHFPCLGKEIPCTLCCNEYSFWCCSLCLRANYIEWILISLLLFAKILLWSVFDDHVNQQCLPYGADPNWMPANTTANACNNLYDASLNFEFKEEVLSSVQNYIFIGLWWVGTMVVSVCITLVLDPTWRRKIVHSRDKKSIKCCNTCWCGRQYARMALVLEVLFREILFVGFYNDVATNVMKLIVGRPRPHIYQSLYLIFTGDFDDDVDDLYKSFPSGHTSMAFAMYTLLTLHIMEAMIVARTRKYEIACMWELEHDKPYFLFCISLWRYFALPGFLTLIAMCPILMATWVGITRITDYHHHVGDVLAGALIGATWAIVGFFVYRNEFRESSVKHEILFEHFTNDIKESFRKYILKPRGPSVSTKVQANTSKESNSNNANTVPSKSTNDSYGHTGSVEGGAPPQTIPEEPNDDDNNDNNNNNNNRSEFDWKNFSISNFFQHGTFKKKQRSSRSFWFWCKMVCCGCNDDCKRVWKFCCCRHSDTDNDFQRKTMLLFHQHQMQQENNRLHHKIHYRQMHGLQHSQPLLLEDQRQYASAPQHQSYEQGNPYNDLSSTHSHPSGTSMIQNSQSDDFQNLQKHLNHHYDSTTLTLGADKGVLKNRTILIGAHAAHGDNSDKNSKNKSGKNNLNGKSGKFRYNQPVSPSGPVASSGVGSNKGKSKSKNKKASKQMPYPLKKSHTENRIPLKKERKNSNNSNGTSSPRNLGVIGAIGAAERATSDQQHYKQQKAYKFPSPK